MNRKILISVLIGIVVIGVSFSLLYYESEPEPMLSYELDFTYSDIDKIQEILAVENIRMSAFTEIKDYTVDQYCTFFDENIQKSVKYCVTTAITTPNGEPLGNFNMGGDDDYPVMAIALVEYPQFLNSRIGEIDIIFQTIVETLVCDCWAERQPGDFESVSSWLDAAEKRYLESKETTLKSKIDGLDEKQLVLEITYVGDSYLWALIVIK